MLKSIILIYLDVVEAAVEGFNSCFDCLGVCIRDVLADLHQGFEFLGLVLESLNFLCAKYLFLLLHWLLNLDLLIVCQLFFALNFVLPLRKDFVTLYVALILLYTHHQLMNERNQEFVFVGLAKQGNGPHDSCLYEYFEETNKAK